MRDDECPASSKWQDFFSIEGGDGRVGQPGVDLGGPVPGDGLVRADVVVVGAAGFHVLDQRQPVVDLLQEEPLVLQGAEPAFA